MTFPHVTNGPGSEAIVVMRVLFPRAGGHRDSGGVAGLGDPSVGVTSVYIATLRNWELKHDRLIIERGKCLFVLRYTPFAHTLFVYCIAPNLRAA